MSAFIYDGLRTPFGRHAGALARVRPDNLLASVIKALVERNAFALEAYEDVIAGCTNQAGEDARNLARHAGLPADAMRTLRLTQGRPVFGTEVRIVGEDGGIIAHDGRTPGHDQIIAT